VSQAISHTRSGGAEMIADAMIEVCLGISLFLCSVWPVRAWLPVSGRAGPAEPAPAAVSCAG
jgi:hypothetical protein